MHWNFAHRDTLCDLPHVSFTWLAIHLGGRYGQLGRTRNLDEAIVLVRDFARKGGQDFSSTLHATSAIGSQKHLQDKEELFDLYVQLVNVPQFVSSVDLSAARAWIRAAEDFHHPTMLLTYETSLRLAQHLVTLPPLPRHLVTFKNLTSSLAVNAFSACLRKRAPERAVQFFEQGRGVFWSQPIPSWTMS